MKRVVGASVLVAFIGAVVVGTCVGFAALMAPAEIKPIVAKAAASEPEAPVPPNPTEQVDTTASSKTAAPVPPAPPAAEPKVKEEEPKKVKRRVAKKVVRVVRRRFQEHGQYGYDQPSPPQMYGSFGGFTENYWR